MENNNKLEDKYLNDCEDDNLEGVKLFLNHEYFNARDKRYQQFALDEGLCRSTSKGMNVMRYLLTSPDLPLHADIHENADRPLRLAIKRGTFEQVEYLCSSPELKDHAIIKGNGNESAFIEACSEGTIECVRFLLTSSKLKIKADIKEIDNQKRDGLFHAISGLNLPVIKYLLTSHELKEKSDISLCAKEGIFFAASKGGLEVIEYLCFSPELKTHVDIEEIKEQLALKAVEFSQLKILKWLMSLDNPPKLTNKNNLKSSIFERACSRENLEILNFIIYDCRYKVTSKEKETVKNYNCPDPSGYLAIVEKRDLFFRLTREIKDVINTKNKKNKI